MKIKQLSVLLGGLLASSLALAATSDYTLDTSSNLNGNYTFNDSGFVDNFSAIWLESNNWSTKTSSSVVRTFQDAASGLWYANTDFTETTSHDDVYQDVKRTERLLTFSANGSATATQWVDLQLSANSPLSYIAFATASMGSRTVLPGVTQSITPVLAMGADDAPLSTTPWSSGFVYDPWTSSWVNSPWSATSYGSVNERLRAYVVATDGGAIESLRIGLASNSAVVGQHTNNVSSSRIWNEDVLISAPVPEPETYAMLLAGLGLLGAVARRRKLRATMV
jgi:hypothetical protein